MIYLLTTLISCMLLFFGVFAVFKTKDLINFYMRLMMKNNSLNIRFSYLKEMIEKKWFLINMKLCGVLIIIVALLSLFAVFHAINN
jgi:hypothetical protein